MLKEVVEALSKLSHDDVKSFAKELWDVRRRGDRVFLAGNGGSASTMSHFASDLSHLRFDALCLNDNQARITALTNDKGWDNVYTAQLWRLYTPGDVFVTASVHGGVGSCKAGIQSVNLVNAAKYVSGHEGAVLSMVGGKGGKLKELSDVSVLVESFNHNVVEGIHSVLCHTLCNYLEPKRR